MLPLRLLYSLPRYKSKSPSQQPLNSDISPGQERRGPRWTTVPPTARSAWPGHLLTPECRPSRLFVSDPCSTRVPGHPSGLQPQHPQGNFLQSGDPVLSLPSPPPSPPHTLVPSSAKVCNFIFSQNIIDLTEIFFNTVEAA